MKGFGTMFGGSSSNRDFPEFYDWVVVEVAETMDVANSEGKMTSR